MPIYEYLCSACAHRFEKRQSFSASTLDECPVCQKPAHRVISKTSFILKGSGWYATDHPSRDRAKASSTSAATQQESVAAPATSPAPSTDTPKSGGDNSHKAA